MMVAENTRHVPALPRDGAAIRKVRSATRAKLFSTVSPRYNPWLHLSLTTGIGVVALALGLWKVRAPSWVELLTIPLTFLVANAFEWHAHKNLLHHRVIPFHILYDRHTPEHHMVFGYDDMAVRDWKELKLVLIPAFGVVGIVGMVAPLAWLLGHFWSPNRGWLMLVTAAIYVVGYELSHMSYHLPKDSFIGRMTLVRILREHHRRHHDPRLMQKWNFNVTIPLADLVMGTVAPKKLIEETLGADAGAENAGESSS